MSLRAEVAVSLRADGLNESGTTDGSWDFAQSRQQPGWPEHIDLPANDFAVLAAAAASLRQSSDVAGEHARFKQP